MRVRGRTKKQGLSYYRRLNREAVRSADNLPKGVYRRSAHEDIPSHGLEGKTVEKTATARNTVIERVRRGEITGAEANEIVRKSKSLAPAYNKGAYQYVGSEDAAKDAGRKGASTAKGER